MITLRASNDRKHRGPQGRAWQTFDAGDRSDLLADGFATLEMLNEDDLAPRARVARFPDHDAELVTYVRRGALQYDSGAGVGVLHAGEFRRTEVDRNTGRGSCNASHKERAHVFHLWLRLGEGERGGPDEQRRFSAAERRGVLCVVASQEAGGAQLHLRQDASIYSALLEPGQHVVHALGVGRSAWLHVVQGAGTLGTLALSTGDGAGVSSERAVSFTAHDTTEILLVDFR